MGKEQVSEAITSRAERANNRALKKLAAEMAEHKNTLRRRHRIQEELDRVQEEEG